MGRAPVDPSENKTGAARSASAPQMRTRPTRTFPEYFFCLKNRHGFSPAVCIDVGAGYGTLSIYKAFPNALHVAVEPLKELIPRLKQALSPYEHIVVEGVLGETNGTLTLLKSDNLLSSTTIHKTPAIGRPVEEVKSFTLDTIMKDVRREGAILLKTDCQGGDLNVIKGGLETLKRCDVVIIETSLFRFWGDHQPDFMDVLRFLKTQGFVPHDFLDGLFRPFDRALGQIDIAFVKEDGPFRKYRHWT